MPNGYNRFARAVSPARVLCVILLALLGLTFVATAAHVAGFVLNNDFSVEKIVWWSILLGAEVAAAVLVWVFRGLVETVVSSEHTVQSLEGHLKRLESLLEAIHESGRRLIELEQMTDTAKSLLFRGTEIGAMNELLHEKLIGQDYTGAEEFVGDIEKRFGPSKQVQQMRKEILSARDTTNEQKVDAALERIGKLIEAHDWRQASRRAARLIQTLPDNPRIAALPGLISDASVKHKRDILQAYGQAVKDANIDRSIELLRELDKYLTPQEAAALQESARGVFRAKLHNLGVQFSIRVTEQEWDAAMAIGRQIVTEYPNCRMAQEVRQKMDALRSLAASGATKG